MSYAVSGRLQTDVLWNIYEYAVYGEEHFRVPFSEANKYPEFIDEKDNLVKALGIYPFLLLLILCTMIYTCVLKKCKSKNTKVRRQYNSLNRKLYYNTLLRFCLEIDLKLAHQAISVTYFVGLASLSTSVIHGFFALFVLIFPFATVFFLLRRRDRLPERNMMARFGTLYQGVKTQHKSTVIHTAMFLFRRLFVVCLVVFLNDS